ncbi:MAG TPA: SH3 domain-containing protein [Anaerolineales bacterium]|nr:SH3 domain-containing protein [Anaerolineales bacterium]
MQAKNLISILALLSLVTACNLQVGPTTQPADADAIGTAVELTTIAKFTEMAGSVTAMPTPLPTLAVTPVATLTPESVVPVSGSCSPTVTANVNANVRSGPGTAYDAIGSLMQGQAETIVGRNDAYTWWYIDYPGVSGGHGWIAASVVTSSCVPAVVQVVAAPPLPTQEVADSHADDSDNENSDDDEDAGDDAPALPDLVSGGMQVARRSGGGDGHDVSVQVRVRNRGEAAAGSFTVEWRPVASAVGCSWTVDALASM